MKHKFLAVAAALTLCLCLSAQANAQESRVQRLKDHVYYFASDSLKGRKAGTEYSAMAAEYIEAQYREAGVVPFYANDTMAQHFKRKTHPNNDFFNVLGWIPGADPEMKNEIIVLGAHYDHLGIDSNGEVYNGADDNASGSAALIEIARELCNRQELLGRSILIAAFDGEELGLFGSYELSDLLAKKDTVVGKVALMVSIDMVGWLHKGGALKIEGVGTLNGGKEILQKHAAEHNLPIKLKKYETSVFTATDTQGFAEKGIATLDMTTGLKSPYHKVGDDADLIDYEGLDKIVGFVADAVVDMSSNKDFGPSGKVAPKHRNSIKTFEIGPKAGIGSSNLIFSDSRMQMQGAFSYNAGVAAKVNFGKYWGLEVDGLFEQAKSYYPIEGNLYTDYGMYISQSVVVPAYVMAQIQESAFRIYYGFGAFYKHNLNSYYTSNIQTAFAPPQNSWGLAATVGMGLGRLILSIDARTDYKAFDTTAFRSSLAGTYFSLTYLF